MVGFRWLSSGLQTWVRATAPNHSGVEGEGNLNLILKLRVPTPSAVKVNNLTCAGNPQPVNREPSLIDEHQQGTTSPSPTLVTLMLTTSRKREVDAYADISSVVADSSILVVWNQSNLVCSSRL